MDDIYIILDPGHSGIDPETCEYTTDPKYGRKYTHNNGNYYHDNGTIYEGVANREIAAAAGLEAVKRGLNVVSVADNYLDTPLSERVKMANKCPAGSIFISIHNNASKNHNSRGGFEVWTTIRKNNSDKLAEHLWLQFNRLSKKYGFKMRQDLSDGDHDKEANHYVTRKVKHVAVLVECLFFDYAPDADLLMDRNYIKDAGKAIVDAVDLFLYEKNKNSF